MCSVFEIHGADIVEGAGRAVEPARAALNRDRVRHDREQAWSDSLVVAWATSR